MSKIYVEVLPAADSSGELSFQSRIRENFEDRAKELAESLAEIATAFRSRLDHSLNQGTELTWPLQEIELKFSIDLQAQAGVVLAKASTTAGFEATLTWKRSDAGKD